MDIRKIFSDQGYEVEATQRSSGEIDLSIRKDGARLHKLTLPDGYDLKTFASGILCGATLR